ncbi:GTP binding protein [Plasmodium cynomolgi strain B]|uniref:GTP binding protein n=1 Tax=Plasmodium cynomolgi (strain B) TaxID=1120755 RepID=K6VB44_PLACD|nr:GTP binding protein [Plasmodium cynomolgi strain B]GAB66412.1 GTP binding protein [Plasmodium cynomolgi strain B]
MLRWSTTLRTFPRTQKRCFTNRSKKEIIVLHPILKKTKSGSKSFEEIIYDAQEALGLARSAGFKVANGISMPLGGWTFFKNPSGSKEEGEGDDLANSYHEEDTFRGSLQSNEGTPCGGDADEGERCLTYEDSGGDARIGAPSEEVPPQGDDLERKIAESIIIKTNRIDNKFYFGKGKLNELSTYFLKHPTPYVFINTLLSPEQFRNLDMLFNSLLRSRHDELKLRRQKQRGEDCLSVRASEFSAEDDGCAEDDGYAEDARGEELAYVEMYNEWMERQAEREDQEDGSVSEGEEQATLGEAEEEGVVFRDDAEDKDVPLYVELFDRYSIILQILKSRAKSNLSKLQLELARANFIFNTYAEDNKSRMKYIKYIENNVLGKSNFDYEEKYSRQNTFDADRQMGKKKNYDHLGYTSSYIKSSETYKEYEKRIIQNLYAKLKKELGKCKNNNALQSSARKHKALIAVVGYTNVGKTKLINYLTKSNLKARNLFFQTLDNAFKSVTLEAIKNADVLIHVIDVCHPYREQHKKCVIDTLHKIGIPSDFLKYNMIEVWNKVDKLADEELLNLYKTKPKNVLPISAKVGTNCDVLIKILQTMINRIKDVQVLTLQFSTMEAQERLAYLLKNFKVVPNSISYSNDGNTTFIKLVENPRNLSKYYERFGKDEKGPSGEDAHKGAAS